MNSLSNSLPDTHHSLIFRLSDHRDQLAWGEFVEIYEPLIHRLTRKQGLQEADAREVTQEILMSVANAVDRWTPSGEQGSFRAWLFRIARNTLINHMIQRSRRKAQDGDSFVYNVLAQHASEDASLTQEINLEYQRRVFHWAAQKVRPKVRSETWQAFWRTAVEEISVEQVAAELGTSSGNIYVAKSRVMSRLRDEIRRLEAEEGSDGCSN